MTISSLSRRKSLTVSLTVLVAIQSSLISSSSSCLAFMSPYYRSWTPTSISFQRPRISFQGGGERRGLGQITPLFMSIDSNDPFLVLGLDQPTTDKKVIKRAYKRMALKYHPDVSTTQQSTPQEKKEASDRFAKINWAYEVLSGKRQNDSTYGTQAPSSSTSSTSSGARTAGWTPPHRRSGPYSSSSSGGSNTGNSGYQDGDAAGGGVDWTDFIPNYRDNQDYDAGGDSFGKIFTDLFVGAAAGAAGMSGGVGAGSNVIKDFIEFLEGNVDGFGTDQNSNDDELRILLRVGSLEEVRNELDDTELVVQQLTQKSKGIQEEIITLTSKVEMTSRYMEKIEIEESLAELNARKEVVQGYAKKAQKRLLTLQTRYKELLMGGSPSSNGQSSRSSSWEDVKREAGSTGTRSSSSSSSNTGWSSDSSSSSGASTSSSQSQQSSKNGEDAWMNEGFGSSTYGRGRGSGRRRARPASSSTSSSSTERSRESSGHTAASTSTAAQSSKVGSDNNTQRNPSYASSSSSSSSRSRPGVDTSKTSATSSSSTSSSSPLQSLSSVPPHRRTTNSYESRQEQDQRRMRELKVDEEFDKLKRELGL
jgi:curved DNA-binding protein CbpA